MLVASHTRWGGGKKNKKEKKWVHNKKMKKQNKS